MNETQISHRCVFHLTHHTSLPRTKTPPDHVTPHSSSHCTSLVRTTPNRSASHVVSLHHTPHTSHPHPLTLTHFSPHAHRAFQRPNTNASHFLLTKPSRWLRGTPAVDSARPPGTTATRVPRGACSASPASSRRRSRPRRRRWWVSASASHLVDVAARFPCLLFRNSTSTVVSLFGISIMQHSPSVPRVALTARERV